MSPEITGLPRFLTPRSGGRSGMAPLQKTVAALVASVAQQAVPLAATVLPVADGIEDYATMAVPVVGKTGAIVEALGLLAAAEMIVAAQAVDLRPGLRLGHGTAAHHAAIRGVVATLDDDRGLAADLDRLDEAIRNHLLQEMTDNLFPPERPAD
jgi:histidine ammonia-lyase